MTPEHPEDRGDMVSILLTDEAKRSTYAPSCRLALAKFVRYHATEGREAVTQCVADELARIDGMFPGERWAHAKAVVTALFGPESGEGLSRDGLAAIRESCAQVEADYPELRRPS